MKIAIEIIRKNATIRTEEFDTRNLKTIEDVLEKFIGAILRWKRVFGGEKAIIWILVDKKEKGVETWEKLLEISV